MRIDGDEEKLMVIGYSLIVEILLRFFSFQPEASFSK